MHDDLCESVAVDIGVGDMHSPCGCDERERDVLRADRAALLLLAKAAVALHKEFLITEPGDELQINESRYINAIHAAVDALPAHLRAEAEREP